MQTLFDTLQHFAFPLICPHCGKLTSKAWPILCQGCFESLELINVDERCMLCFEKHAEQGQICLACRTKKQHASFTELDYFASAFEYFGPIKTLICEFKYHDRPYLAKSFAAFLFLQLEYLKWPTPDLLLFIPQNFSKWLFRGYNQSELLAKELSKLIDVPTKNYLKKQGVHLSQATLSRNERKNLDPRTFRLAADADIADKTILLIDDVCTTGSTIKQAAKALRSGCPKNIYGLTVCLTSKE